MDSDLAGTEVLLDEETPKTGKPRSRARVATIKEDADIQKLEYQLKSSYLDKTMPLREVDGGINVYSDFNETNPIQDQSQV
jgi:hypothetical protein